MFSVVLLRLQERPMAATTRQRAECTGLELEWSGLGTRNTLETLLCVATELPLGGQYTVHLASALFSPVHRETEQLAGHGRASVCVD